MTQLIYTQQKLTKIILTILFTCSIHLVWGQKIPAPLRPIDEQRVQEIEKMLPDKPAGFGAPCKDRKVWSQLLNSGEYDRFLRAMRNFKFPPFSTEAYFSLFDGTASSSAEGLTMMRERAAGLSKVTWAECLQDEGKFIDMLENGLRDILNQKSWVSPRSDYDFKNYKGIQYSVELTSALYAHTIAQTLYLMGNRINPKLRKQAIDALNQRIFDPILDKLKTQNTERENNFLIETNNWNHVCLSGLVGAALTVIEDKRKRAIFTYIGEYYSKNGLSSFGDDGYCTEGLTYYGYGFGHYILLRENIFQATGGKIDLFKDPKVQKIGRYVPNLEIINGVFPAISDCVEGSKADNNIMIYLNRSLGMGLARYDSLTVKPTTSDIRKGVLMSFLDITGNVQPSKTTAEDNSNLRSFFDQAEVLVCRPAPGSASNIGIAFKGGNNNDSHNHNDIGSYTIVQGSQIIAGDPGKIPYTADIFEPEHRYTYKTVASYGHPVPLVAGIQQRPGAEAQSKTVDKHFSAEKDIITLDIASAYNAPGLKKLERTMEYNRAGSGSILITDNFGYEKASKFETAITTRSKWSQTSDSTLVFTRENEKMVVSFSSPGNKVQLRSEEISEGGKPYTRIGIYITEPVTEGKIVVSYQTMK